MTSDELKEAAKRTPFRPFRIILTTGETHDIRHPDLIMVGRRTATIGLVRDVTDTIYELSRLIDLFHIVAIEDLPPVEVSSNGAVSES